MMFFSFRPQWLVALTVVFAVALSGCQQSTQTESQDLIRSQTWHMDASNQATLADAEAAKDWQPFSNWKSWGYGPETIWVRLQLKGHDTSDRTPWVVQVQPTYLNRVTLYDPVAGVVIKTGNLEPQNSDQLSIIDFMFQISPLPYERTVYLKIRTTTTRTLKVDVLPQGHIERQNRLLEWLTVFVISASTIITIWAFAQWWGIREQLIGIFALKQVFTTFYLFFTLGFARIIFGQWISEESIEAIRTTLQPWAISMTIWFFFSLLKGYQPNRYVLIAIQVVATVTAMLPVLQLTDHRSEMLMLAQISIVLSLSLILIAILSALPKRIKQPISLNALLIYLLIYCVFNSITPLINLASIPANFMTPFGGFAHSLLDGIVMFVMLQIRVQNLRNDQQKITSDFQKIQETFSIEKRYREEQSQLFAMLAHEMKTPLASLRMWMEAGQLKPETMERSINDMNQVIERCVQTGQLAEQGLRPISQSVSPVELTRQSIQSCRASERVDFDAPSTDELLHTDAQMLSVVLSNLLDNACKYAAPQSRIQVNLTPTNEDGNAGWSWQISNLVGPIGLPDPDQLFAKYYRSPRALSLSGSGLGLFLVKGLLELLKGSIHYETQQDQAIFSVWVPSTLSTS